MYLQSLQISSFKNHEFRHFEFSPLVNCLTGLNGSGKTNVLDAIHYLCLTKSHSGLPDKSLIRREGNFFRIEGLFVRDGIPEKVIAKCGLGQRRVLERNGGPVQRISDYIGMYPMVMIAPDDGALVQEGGEERRRFMDVTLAQISAHYLLQLVRVNSLLRQRSALLRQASLSGNLDMDLLKALDYQLLEPSTYIFQAREDLIRTFAPVFEAIYAHITADREQVQVQYASDLHHKPLEAWLTELLPKDRLLQRTGAGIHRDDLLLTMNNQPVRKFASQGQLKSTLLALRLAQYEFLMQQKKLMPVLLLDDIFDKLDENRVSNLLSVIKARGYGQTFITDTHAEKLRAVLTGWATDYGHFHL